MTSLLSLILENVVSNLILENLESIFETYSKAGRNKHAVRIKLKVTINNLCTLNLYCTKTSNNIAMRTLMMKGIKVSFFVYYIKLMQYFLTFVCSTLATHSSLWMKFMINMCLLLLMRYLLT